MKTRSDVELLAELEKELAELQTTIGVLKRRIGGTANGDGSAAPAPAPVELPIDKPMVLTDTISAWVETHCDSCGTLGSRPRRLSSNSPQSADLLP